MNIRRAGIAILLAGFMYSCSTKLNIDAPYKETTVVYGLLDQLDTATYIKINKAFLGVADAYTMAKAYDSSNYPNILTVQLQQISMVTGSLVKTITLSRDSSIAKPSGTFSSPEQILYKTKARLDSSCQYNLVITNNKTHAPPVTGSTQLISNFSISIPYGGSPGNLSFGNAVTPQRIEWVSATNGVVYTITLRFYYYEQDITTKAITKKHLDWIMPNQIAPIGGPGQTMYLDIPGATFFQFLKSELSPLNSNTNRFIATADSASIVDLIFDIGTQDLNTYISVSQPTNSITQSQPQYTDISNGWGLFSARYHIVKSPNYITLSSIDSLYGGQFTGNLFSSSFQ
jgi:hypothetical protein